jgi:nucleotide-binding universal stress UspA family protein
LLWVLPPADAFEDETVTATTTEWLRRIGSELTDERLALESVVRKGDPAQQIVERTAARGVDLVIMHTDGRAGLRRAVVGSVSERVQHACSMPVLLMRCGGRRISHLRKIVVPIDGALRRGPPISSR